MIIKITKTLSPRAVLIFAYSTIILLWLLIGIKTIARMFSGNAPILLDEIIWDSFFAILVTGFLFFLFRQFHHHILERAREHEKLFRENPHAMWIYDVKTLRFLSVNQAARELYGYTEKEFLTMCIDDIRPDEEVPALISKSDLAKVNFDNNYHWSGTWQHKKKNNELMYVEISSYEIVFEGRKAELVLAYNVTDKVLQDLKLQALNQDLEKKVITRTNDLLHLNKRLIDQNKVIKSANFELFTISNQLQEANKKIQENADLKSRFVSMASHEFRTPLFNIKSSATFIKRFYGKTDKENIFSKVDGIQKQVAHMLALLDDVLTIGKVDTTKLKVNIDEVNIHDFIVSIIHEVQTANNKSHHIHLSLDDKVQSFINTDEKFLRNIFINLLTNAVKYSVASHDVYVRIYNSDHGMCFDVVDNGSGINKEDLTRIFEPFYRTDSAQNIQGTGLGLSIVKKAADLLGAEIEVESEVGKGSTFRVILPIDRVVDPAIVCN